MTSAADTAYYYLALGDSYTIGEQVEPAGNFPNQAYRLMKQHYPGLIPPRIIARTGWTTDELQAGINEAAREEPLRPVYDMVTLLIGVNNQYRGRTAEAYRPEFEALLKKALQFAGNRKERVLVLSVPDWGVTPFAEGRDRAAIAGEIDTYNKVNREVAEQYQVKYVDITAWTREAAHHPELLAPDGLHPSALEYSRWAEKISSYFNSVL